MLLLSDGASLILLTNAEWYWRVHRRWRRSSFSNQSSCHSRVTQHPVSAIRWLKHEKGKPGSLHSEYSGWSALVQGSQHPRILAVHEGGKSGATLIPSATFQSHRFKQPYWSIASFITTTLNASSPFMTVIGSCFLNVKANASRAERGLYACYSLSTACRRFLIR